MAVRVFLGDLRYNFAGMLANDCMPLGVAYMKAVMDRDLPASDDRVAVTSSIPTGCSTRSSAIRPTC